MQKLLSGKPRLHLDCFPPYAPELNPVEYVWAHTKMNPMAKGIDSDNDRAFINAHLLKYCEKEGLNFTRSRPNRKNDNAYIEQKNYTHVRRPSGYLRYDTEEELKIINDLYGNELRLYKNFFQPVMKLTKKERVDGRLKRVYDIAKTPYQRLIESGQLSKEQEKPLKKLYRVK